MRAHLIALVVGLLLGIGSPAARADTPARPLEESSVSPESTTGILGNERVRVRLYWVRGDAR